MDTEELQQRLARLAEHTAPPPRAELAEVVVERGRTQRRQRIAVGSLVAAVVAVVIAAPLLLDGAPAGPHPADQAPATSTSALEAFRAPTRGSLAGDATLVEAVRRLPWTSGDSPTDVPDAPLDTRRVLFAGDVGGARLALVAGTNTAQPESTDPALQTDLGALSDVAVVWFVGPAGAAPDQLVAGQPHGTDSYGGPPAVLDGPTGVLVVVGVPGDRVEVSARPDVLADGSVHRDWEPVDAPEGVATTVLPAGSTSAQALRYRLVRGSESWTSGPETVAAIDPPADVPVTALREAPAPSPADVLATSDPAGLLLELGLPVGAAQFTVVWAGDVPAPSAAAARVSLLAATLPSGAVFVQASLGIELGDGAVGGTWCGQEIRPAGPPVAEQTFALRCDATDMSADSGVVSSLVVVAPPGTASARALDLDGAVLAEFPLTDGVAVVPFPERGATVETLGADGSVLDRTRPLTSVGLGN